MPPSAGWIPSLLLVGAAMAFGGVVAFWIVYAIEYASISHPHAMVGILAILIGVPSGWLMGAIAAVRWLRTTRPTRVTTATVTLFAWAVVGVGLFVAVVGERW